MTPRAGDKVRLRDAYIEACDGVMLTLRIPIGMGLAQATVRIHSSAVKDIIERAETDAEKIARLEARNAELESGWVSWDGGPCPFHPDASVDVLQRSGTRYGFAPASRSQWVHTGSPRDVVAFRFAAKPASPVGGL